MPDLGAATVAAKQWGGVCSGLPPEMLRVKPDSELTVDNRKDTEEPSVTISRVDRRGGMNADIKTKLGMEAVGPAAAPIKSYSDFMRSLAAKYNNNENGLPEPRLPSIKAGVPPFFGFPAGFAGLPGFPALPGVTGPLAQLGAVKDDPSKAAPPQPFAMEPSQALLTLARSAGVELPGLLGAVQMPPSPLKRPRGDSPLDLTDKRPKVEQQQDVDKEGSSSSSRASSPSRESPDPSILNWTVDQVAQLVASVDICKEYEQVFREHNIDGGALPLLTETHMTSQLGMKLGPALKLKTVLRRKLGPEVGVACVHCAHCHQVEEGGRDREEEAQRPGSRSSGPGDSKTAN